MSQLCLRGASLLSSHLRGRQLSTASGKPRGGRVRRLLKWSVGGAVVVSGGVVLWRHLKPVYTVPEGEKRKRVVILGSGWGATSVLHHLTPGQFDVTVVSPRNYFLFTPLLPSVTVGTVESRSIVEPIRKLIRKHHKDNPVTFLEAECVGIDHTHKNIQCEDRSGIVGEVSKWDVPYDILVVAVGASTDTFGTPGVREHCHFLKEIPDAQSIRNDIIDLVETASIPGQSQAEQERLLHFIVVGGGPTGVEFAAEVQDFLREDVSKIYPGIKDRVKVTLVQSRDHILNTYDQTISEYTEQQFQSDKINLVTNARVQEVTADTVTVLYKKTGEKQALPYGVCVWSTGVSPVPITKKFMEQIPEQGKGRAILTDKYLRVKGAEGVFAMGDCSTVEQDLLITKAKELFKLADVNGDGTLTKEEFHGIIEKAKAEFPQVQVQLSYVESSMENSSGCDIGYKKPDTLGKLFESTDTSGDQLLDYNEFVAILKKMDRNLKSFPATAQVASQQGEYLGDLLSATNGEMTKRSTQELEGTGISPFKYRHLGSFAYVGDGKAVLQLPLIGSVSGWWTMWLWRAAYASECASTRSKLLVCGDWAKARVFGRDSSRI